MDVAHIVGELRPHVAAGALIALDFDGTLAPIVPDPQDSRPAAGALEALASLRAAGARVAVITGRDAETVVRLGGLDTVPGLRVAGLYGAETWSDGTLTTLPTPQAIQALRSALPTRLEGADPDVWIEDKRLSLVVHTRKTSDPSGERDRLAPRITELGEQLGFLVELGNGVVEFRLPGYDKGAVLRELVTSAGGAPAVLYAGDDLGDLPAFAEVGRLRAEGIAAWSVGVSGSGVPEVADAADVSVPDVAGVVDLLQALMPQSA